MNDLSLLHGERPTLSRLWRGSLRRLGILCLAATALLASGSKSRAADPTLADITKALQDWKRSWLTLRVKYERRNPGMVKRYFTGPNAKAAVSVEGYFFAEEWIFTGDGSQRHEQHLFRDGKNVSTDISATRPRDSLYFHAMWMPKFGSDVLIELSMSTFNPPMTSPDGRQMACLRSAFPIHPLYNMVKHEWLGDTLDRGLGTLEEFEDVEGVRCARVRIGTVTIWFDSEHGFLPCRAEDWVGEEKGDLWLVSEFQHLSTEAWFPQRGTCHIKSYPEDEIDEWLVLEVAVNEALAPALFEPPTPVVGTNVRDLRSGKIYTVTDERALEAAAIAPRAEKNVPVPDANPVSAEIPYWDRFKWPALVLAPAILLLAAGLWFTRSR